MAASTPSICEYMATTFDLATARESFSIWNLRLGGSEVVGSSWSYAEGGENWYAVTGCCGCGGTSIDYDLDAFKERPYCDLIETLRLCLRRVGGSPAILMALRYGESCSRVLKQRGDTFVSRRMTAELEGERSAREASR
ncbi:hypothetical protein Tco_0625317 [Tanacetum coccineum]|uniref:Uncharacterized protein n=1 Tax=Tanacetum coccineum TaxID=301880 RepID=A0ABQ4WGK6_9ASTR